jgi:hypothetical protein
LLLSNKILRFRRSFCLKAQKLLQPLQRQHGLALETGSCSAGPWNWPGELYLTTQVEFSTRMSLRKSSFIVSLAFHS